MAVDLSSILGAGGNTMIEAKVNTVMQSMPVIDVAIAGRIMRVIQGRKFGREVERAVMWAMRGDAPPDPQVIAAIAQQFGLVPQAKVQPSREEQIAALESQLAALKAS
jgi:hypothetical protein